MAELDNNHLDHGSLTPRPTPHLDDLVGSLTHLSSRIGLSSSSSHSQRQKRVLRTDHTPSAFLSTHTQPTSPTLSEASSCLPRTSLLYRSQGFLHRRCRSEPFSTPTEAPLPSARADDAHVRLDQSGFSARLTSPSNAPRESGLPVLGTDMDSSDGSRNTNEGLEVKVDNPKAFVWKAPLEVAVVVPASSSSSGNASSTILQNSDNETGDDSGNELDDSDNEADDDLDRYMMSSYCSDLSEYEIPHVR